MSSGTGSSDSDFQMRTAREKMIEDAMIDCHTARSDVLKSQQLHGEVDREFSLRLQQSIIDYYYALKPLRSESPVSKWWSDVRLSDKWVKKTRVEESVTGDIESGVQVQQERVKEYYKGLDTIEKLQSLTETITKEKSGMAGRREVTETRQKVLDTSILLDISSTLDDAATKLGFAPNTPLEEETEPDPV